MRLALLRFSLMMRHLPFDPLPPNSTSAVSLLRPTFPLLPLSPPKLVPLPFLPALLLRQPLRHFLPVPLPSLLLLPRPLLRLLPPHCRQLLHQVASLLLLAPEHDSAPLQVR